jgi:hypothetical protein
LGAAAGATTTPQTPQPPQAASQQAGSPQALLQRPQSKMLSMNSRAFFSGRWQRFGQQLSQAPQAFSHGAGQAFSQQATGAQAFGAWQALAQGAGQAFSQQAIGAQAFGAWQAFSQQAGSGAQHFTASQAPQPFSRQPPQSKIFFRPLNRS